MYYLLNLLSIDILKLKNCNSESLSDLRLTFMVQGYYCDYEELRVVSLRQNCGRLYKLCATVKTYVSK